MFVDQCCKLEAYVGVTVVLDSVLLNAEFHRIGLAFTVPSYMLPSTRLTVVQNGLFDRSSR